MRYGFTTGSCAAAAAKAATYMLLSGNLKTDMTIMTPKGIPFAAQICQIERSERQVSCAVKKDGGDDPDITTGSLIFATVCFYDEPVIKIEGGRGVGRVTKPGLDQPVGYAAINHVPREMMQKEVREVCELWDYHGGLSILIEVPNGLELAKKTFNPRLGIEGGISILGTTGIVEPMSTKALLDTIYIELRQKREMGASVVAVSPGNYGLDFMKKTYGYDLEQSVKCSNFIGDTIDMAKELGFSAMLLTGHIGKLIKLSGGMMNTHSKEGDCRMELMTAAALRAGCSREVALQLLDSVTTEQGVAILQQEKLLEQTCDFLKAQIAFYLKKRAADKMQIAFMMYATAFGMLAKSDDAEIVLAALRKESV